MGGKLCSDSLENEMRDQNVSFHCVFPGARGHVIDPYVLIELFGFPPDCSDQRTTTALNNSGDSPFFDELFEFRLFLPSLALVRFVVLDDDFIGDEFIGRKV